MRPTRPQLWLALKALLALAIVVGVGRQFAKVLGSDALAAHPLHVDWPLLMPAGLLYLCAHSLWGAFWVRLMRSQGVRIGYAVGLRTYFVSQFGKYVPGKAWVIVMRVGMLRPSGAHPLPVAVTATYETLTSMGAGAMLGFFLLPYLGVLPDAVSGNAALFGAVACLPIAVGLLNKLVVRVASRSRRAEAPPLPSPPLSLLLQGLAQGAIGWCLLSLSLALTIRALAPVAPAWTWPDYLGDLAAVALSYVAGFVVLVAPGGLGARELVLQRAVGLRFDAILGPELAAAFGAAVALVLRLVWTAAEVALALALYLWKPTPPDASHAKEGIVPDPLPALQAGATALSLVVPVLNERESLAPLHAEMAEVGRKIGAAWEVVFVDDGSTDGSWRSIAALAAADPHVRGIRFRRNFGKAAALAAGFAASRGRVVCTLDADLQDDPNEVPRFLAAVEGGIDVVSGWKKVRFDPWHKVWPSRIFNAMVGRVTGVWLHDHNCGMKAYRAEVFHEVRLYGELHRFIPVLAAARGFRVGELVIAHRPRKFGHSKYGWRRFAKGFLDLITVKFLTGFGHRPQHLLGYFGLLPAVAGTCGLLGLAANAIARAIEPGVGLDAIGQIVAAVVAVGLLLFGTQLFIAGLIAELIVDRGPDDLDPYCIAEQTPEAAHP